MIPFRIDDYYEPKRIFLSGGARQADPEGLLELLHPGSPWGMSWQLQLQHRPCEAEIP
jgi:hypothetical protein